MSRNANGSGNIRKKKVTRNGKTYEYWEARFTTGYNPATGKQIQRSITAPTQKDAAMKMRVELSKLDNHKYTPPNKMTLKQWSDIWLSDYARPSVKPSTYYTYSVHISKHIIPVFASVKLCEISAHDVQKFCNDLSSKKHLAPKTVRTVVGTFRKCLNQAVDLSYISSNPVTLTKLPKQVQREIRPLTDSEIDYILSGLKNDVFSDLIRTALFTGMREGEICGLSWNDIDFVNGTVTVRQQLVQSKETGDYSISTTKNDKIRVLHPASYVMDILRARQNTQNKDRQASEKYSLWDNKWNLVFTYEDGSNLPLSTVRGRFKRTLKKAGITDVRFHDLRHTFAVISLQEGDDIKTVQSNLGHASASFTLDVYGHISDKMIAESSSRMQSFIETKINDDAVTDNAGKGKNKGKRGGKSQ